MVANLHHEQVLPEVELIGSSHSFRTWVQLVQSACQFYRASSIMKIMPLAPLFAIFAVAASAAPLSANQPFTYPKDVLRLMGDRELCNHFAGEEPYDADRRKEIEKGARICIGLDKRLAMLKRRYARNSQVTAKLRMYEDLLKLGGNSVPEDVRNYAYDRSRCESLKREFDSTSSKNSAKRDSLANIFDSICLTSQDSTLLSLRGKYVKNNELMRLLNGIDFLSPSTVQQTR